MPPLPDVLRSLTALRGDFSPVAYRRKHQLVRALGQLSLKTAVGLQSLHDELQFLAAFPDTTALGTTAWKALGSFHHRTRELPLAELERLADSGIAGTTSLHTYMHGAVRWLASKGAELAPRWSTERDAERLDPLIRHSMLPAEADGFDDSGLSTRAWLEAASRRLPGGMMQWLVGGAGAGNDPAARDRYDDAEVPVAWRIGDSPWSVSRNRVPGITVTVRTAFRKLPRDPRAWITTPLAGIRRLEGAEAAAWMDASLGALVARCREVVPTMYANPGEVYLADLGEGAALCVIGAHPTDRLALEANYGYVMFSNGIPIGYGGVTPLADQANTGTNIFEAFRGSEAAFLFARSLRAFHTLFGVSRFIVNPYQFGAGNDEALQSGAFWFYDRLGFRPADEGIEAVATRERARLAGRPGTRTSLRTLRALARGDLVLDLRPSSAVPRFDEHHLATLGRCVAATLSHVPACQRVDYVMQLAREQKRALAGSEASLSPVEARGARLLSPLLALTADAWGRWSAAARADAWSLVRLKGAAAERAFVRRARTHESLWTGLTVAAHRARHVRGR